MSLADLIRKRSTRNLATAIPAIPATQDKGLAETVARIATVAVANPPDPLSTQDEATIRAWLEHIGETDPEELARVWERCRTRLDTRAYVLAQAAQMPATASPAGRVAMLEEVPAMGTTRHLAAIQRPDVRAAADAFHNHLAHRGGPCGLQACAEIPGIDP